MAQPGGARVNAISTALPDSQLRLGGEGGVREEAETVPVCASTKGWRGGGSREQEERERWKWSRTERAKRM